MKTSHVSLLSNLRGDYGIPTLSKNMPEVRLLGDGQKPTPINAPLSRAWRGFCPAARMFSPGLRKEPSDLFRRRCALTKS